MLETAWFIIWGILWAVYFLLDGFDLGLGIISPFAAQNDVEKRIVYHITGPLWDGNEVWLVTAGGVTFAAFPPAYATLFSSLYSPFMLILFALIIRASAIEFRNKRKTRLWKLGWDTSFFFGSFFASFLFGVVFANIFQGISIDENGVFQGTLMSFLNPYGVAGGILFLNLFILHGSLWLAIKSEGGLYDKSIKIARYSWSVLLVLLVIFLIMTELYTNLFNNYLKNPSLFFIAIFLLFSLFITRFFIKKNSWTKAWIFSSLAIAGFVLFGIAGLYPNILPSNIDPSYSLTIFNSRSSYLTLKIMLWVALITVPVVILYQFWAYRLFRGKVTGEDAGEEDIY